jgi:hypothetical protein
VIFLDVCKKFAKEKNEVIKKNKNWRRASNTYGSTSSFIIP